MTKLATKAQSKRRTASKEKRRLQLIRATIRSIAKRGLSETTIATVAGEAKLSQGIINLHFQSKDRLMVETLRYVADEYRQVWQSALEKTGSGSAERLAALVEADFDKKVCDRNKVAVWFAFWGESKSRPTYRKICAERDEQYDDLLIELCTDIAQAGRYKAVAPEAVAKGLSAMTEGLWLDLLIDPKSMTPERAKSISFEFLSNVFPSHFGDRSALLTGGAT
jgi:AcrR family transcriptional regulator